MRAFSFHAGYVVSEDPEGFCRLAGFAGRKHKTGTSLLLQRGFAAAEDERARAPGHDTFYLEWRGQDKSGYGGSASLVLGPDRAEIAFRPEWRGCRMERSGLQSSFQPGSAEHRALDKSPGHIVRDSDCFQLADH